MFPNPSILGTRIIDFKKVPSNPGEVCTVGPDVVITRSIIEYVTSKLPDGRIRLTVDVDKIHKCMSEDVYRDDNGGFTTFIVIILYPPPYEIYKILDFTCTIRSQLIGVYPNIVRYTLNINYTNPAFTDPPTRTWDVPIIDSDGQPVTNDSEQDGIDMNPFDPDAGGWTLFM